MTEKERKLAELKFILIARRLNWYRNFPKEDHLKVIQYCPDIELTEYLSNIAQRKKDAWEQIRERHKERIQRIREEREEKKL